MKIDYDIIKEILFEAESSGKVAYNEKTEDDKRYHIVLLIESELIKGSITTLVNGYEMPYGRRLTWEGHQFLESIRDDTRWGKAKSILNKLGSFTYPVVQKVCQDLLLSAIK